MSTNKTENYQLNQWVGADRILMDDFNADNAKIDAALKGHDDSVAALWRGLGTVGTNCRIMVGSYVGDGTYRQSSKSDDVWTSLSFPFYPLAVIIVPVYRTDAMQMGSGVFVRPMTTARLDPNVTLSLIWSDKGVKWEISGGDFYAANQLNNSGSTYYYIALGRPEDA